MFLSMPKRATPDSVKIISIVNEFPSEFTEGPRETLLCKIGSFNVAFEETFC